MTAFLRECWLVFTAALVTNGESPSFAAWYSAFYLFKSLKFNFEQCPQQGGTISKIIYCAFVYTFILKPNYLFKLFFASIHSVTT